LRIALGEAWMLVDDVFDDVQSGEIVESIADELQQAIDAGWTLDGPDLNGPEDV
jgi:hypothetical protein